MKKYMAKETAVLFSGGTDSGLAAALCLEKFERVILLTFDPGFIFFVNNSKTMVDWLKVKYGNGRIVHKIIDARPAIKKMMLNYYKQDFRKYGFNMAILGCLSCRLAMHTMAIIHNMEHQIPYLADGAISKQSIGPEQMVSVIKRNQRFYSSQFGIIQFSPIYSHNRSDIVLFNVGISPIKHMKRQFILFDTQATCPFGVPADVYGRLFYGLLGDSREKDGEAMCNNKYPLMKDYITRYFNDHGQDMAKLINGLKQIRKTTPFDHEDFYVT